MLFRSFDTVSSMLAIIVIILCSVMFSNGMPLAMELVDMSYVFDETIQVFPTVKRFTVDNLINGTVEEFGGVWLQLEEYSSAIHVGTHMDAPSHFIKGGKNVDEIPVSQLMGPAAVIDIIAKADLNPDAEATIEDLLQWESTTSQTLNGTIVLLKSGWGHRWNDSLAFQGTLENDLKKLHFPGIAPEACQWLVDNRVIKGIGTEALSIDIGQSRTFLSHIITLGHDLFILENVANMDKLPIYGAKLYALPMKIGKGSGAPTRIVAMIPKVIYAD